MTKTIPLFLFLCLSSSIFAQFYDNHWMMGYEGGDRSPPNDSFGVSILSFYDAELKIEDNQTIDLFFDISGNSFSNYTGDLLLYSNNREVRNIEDQPITNGILEENGFSEQAAPQTFTFLPFDFSNLVHYVQMTYSDDPPSRGQNLSTSFIKTNGVEEIYNKIENILTDSLNRGQLTACRHANGRDWWVLVPFLNQPVIYSVLLNPEGVTLVDTIVVTHVMQSGLGQAKFSPDGNHYVRYNKVNLGQDDYLDIFDFDRNTGKVSNHLHTTISANANAGGVAISPSSQYLYVSHYNHVLQYDLWADDVFASMDTVATYDGYTEWNFFHSRFFMGQLAPDGKIYMNNASGVKTLHVIEYPDRKGEACDVRQHSIQLPNNNSFTLANHPHYRLGPIDGSPADSLGIDNLPRAYYRIDRNAEDTLNFHFQDLSFYEAGNWSWTFGDGGSSNERHPDHTFAGPGIYEVCLTVSNEQGNDTHCRTIELGTVSVDVPNTLTFSTFPNPVQDVLVFDLGDYLPLNGQFKLYDAVGREVFSQQVLYRQASFNLGHLVPGVYYYSFWDQGRQIGRGKVVRGE
ncbi:PKD domain-containing protein [Neolewinella agarilytica]|uniref:PKD domain-containing protein n=1 Tax=Neolewinella agarilytica TaxID=478744 RepID=UPI00235404BF|nr:PKD domain-containing protein [Neolewinella agarilytica]